MSGRKSTKDEAGGVEITVIRSGDAKRSKISISLSSTLNALRDAISTDAILGPIKHSEQRLFYLGRELKSGNRTLFAMGIGNYNIFVLHLHSLAPKLVDLQCDEEKDDDIGQKKKSGEVARRGKSDGNRNADNGSDAEAAGTRRTRRLQRKEKDNVVELLDSDNEDGDDDAVEIIETAPKRRRRG